MDKTRFKRFFDDYIIPILIVVILYFLINIFMFTMVRVSGDSMQPNLQNNERVMVVRTPIHRIHRLGVIVFNAHGEDPSAKASKDYYVKRVIGLPGDTVTHAGNQIYVNGKPLNQKFISNFQRSNGTGITAFQRNGNWTINKLSEHWPNENGNRNSFKVPAGHYFVLGDNRDISNDSRYWGFVNSNEVMGTVKALPLLSNNSNERQNINDVAQK